MKKGFLFEAYEDQVATDWKTAIGESVSCRDFQKIEDILIRESKQGKIFYPPVSQIFQALSITPFQSVKCVILGQDPYHQPNQAMGLSFSVNDGVAIPPSLRNIFKEGSSDVNLPIPSSGDLSSWARNGVLLINSILTVSEGLPLSHQGIGWENFIGKVLTGLSDQKSFVVFVLWGQSAQKFKPFINAEKHKIIDGVHPSPLSAHRGFFGSKPFSTINQALLAHGLDPIHW